MGKSWTVAAMIAWMVSGGVARVHAGDDFEARLTKQCPGMAPWVQAEDAKAAALKTHPLKPSKPALHDELLKMGHDDQNARNAEIADDYKHPELWKATQAVDARNLPRIKQIDAKQGFPTPGQVGYDGMQAAFLLVQHADTDPAFQAHVLNELKSRPDQGGIGAQNYAMLIDRVLTAQHKPQRYGTQFDTGSGTLKPKPIEDAANVDKRRAAIGLPPLTDYACMLWVVYKLPAKS